MNENDKREAVKRILHDFVMLKLSGNATIDEVASLLRNSADKVYRLFEDDLNQYGQMRERMRNSGYADGPSGISNMVRDVKRHSEDFETIRKAFGDPNLSRYSTLIAAAAEKAIKENKAHQQERFDFLAYGQMCEVLEDAGYSPDADGIKALLGELKEFKHVVTRVESVVDAVDPELRKRQRLEHGVSAMGQQLVTYRSALAHIQQRAENVLR